MLKNKSLNEGECKIYFHTDLMYVKLKITNYET